MFPITLPVIAPSAPPRRELGLWFADGPEYYARPGARYLTYRNDVLRFVADVAEARFGGAMPLFYKHMVGMAYQLALFRCVTCAVLCCVPACMMCPFCS